jgi:hypothetical protein
MTIRDRAGKEVDIDRLLDEALAPPANANPGWVAAGLVTALFVGVAVLAVIAYHVFF